MGLIDRPEIDITPWCIRLKPAAEVSPKLREYQDENGKIDFGNTDALNAYNKAALRVMSGLKLQLPPRNLVPTICLRQAYLTVLIDELLSRGSNILEIGTGASAIISMIASKNHGLNVTATELSDESYQSALNNIEMNKLENISLIKSSGGIIKGVISPETSFDAVLCYPPTYPEGDRKEYGGTKPLSGFKGTESEMIGGGDEGYDFIQQYLEEAINSRIMYVTVLLIFEQHADYAESQLLEAGKTVRRILLKAGTRRRYLLIAS